MSYSNAFCDGHLYHGNADHVFSGPGQDLEVFSQATKSAQASQGAFDDPALGQDLESLGRFVADIHPPVEPFIDPSATIVIENDELGRIAWLGNYGTNIINAAYLRCFVDGTPGANDMPGRLSFWTSADGAPSPTERMRINSAGGVFIGDTTNANMTIGLTIKQGANDNEIMAFKSSDVAQPITDSAEADTFGVIAKAEADSGGIRILGYKDSGSSAGHPRVMDYSKLALIIVKKLDRLSAIEVGSPFTDSNVEVIEELRALIDIFTNSWND